MQRTRHSFFVTGTDTGVGKTFVACGILRAAASRGMSTAAVKPVAAGTVETPEGPRNEDALALRRVITLPLAYEEVNPACLTEAVAPHLAARHAGKQLRVERLAGCCRGVMMQGADLCLIEGAGGWKVPLNERELLSHLARELNVPVILVVGMRLGCLNHALLSAQAILLDRLPLAGWIANQVEPAMACYEENRDTLRALLPAPMLAEVKYRTDFHEAGGCAEDIDIDNFLAHAVSRESKA